MDTIVLNTKSMIRSLSLACLAIFLFKGNAEASQIRSENIDSPNIQSFSKLQQFDNSLTPPIVRKRPSSALTRSHSYMGFNRHAEKPQMSLEEKKQRVSDLIKKNSPHTEEDIINLITGDRYFAIFSPKVPDSWPLQSACPAQEKEKLAVKSEIIKNLTIGTLIELHNYDNDMYPISTVGYYNGDIELSFFVVSRNEKDLKECVTRLGSQLDQDCVIFGGHGKVFLYENSSKNDQEIQPEDLAYDDDYFFSSTNNPFSKKVQWIKKIEFRSCDISPCPNNNCTGFCIKSDDDDNDDDDNDDIDYLWLQFSERAPSSIPSPEAARAKPKLQNSLIPYEANIVPLCCGPLPFH